MTCLFAVGTSACTSFQWISRHAGDNFQCALNELSYKMNIFFQHKTSKRHVKYYGRSYGQLERLVRAQRNTLLRILSVYVQVIYIQKTSYEHHIEKQNDNRNSVKPCCENSLRKWTTVNNTKKKEVT